MSELRIAFVGGGNMASAMVGGIVKAGHAPNMIDVADLSQEQRNRLQNEFGVSVHEDANAAIAQADVVILAVKPQVLHQVVNSIADTLQKTKPLIISVAAGIRGSDITRWLGYDAALVRAMPNTPALVQTGATGLYANMRVTEAQKQITDNLLQTTGITMWVDNEAGIDAVTAISGSGPAYFFLIFEAMQAAGEQLGLDAETAGKLAQQTALGAAKMALNSELDPAQLRVNVTSPGGTTEQALNSLEAAGIRGIFSDALNAANTRAQELADLLGKD